MSANLLDGVTPTLAYGSMADGVITSSTPKDDWKDVAAWPITSEAFAENQTMHLGLSAKWHGAAATTGAAWASVKYANAAGNAYDANVRIDGITTEWKRFSLSAVVPSGMRLVDFHFSGKNLDAAYDATSFVLSCGSPVPLATSAHTPYATQDHVAAEYATKAALKVTSDAVTAEVEERGKLAGRVGTLESTSGTHASKLEQLATSIKSLVKGESTYTDPDGKSATSGIYSLVTQTRDSVTALFGSYTKTADLASTQAVKDAKKAGTDAQAAASAAQTTADSAKSTAQAAASDAATAKTNAASAVSTANGAASSAANAVKTANAASSTASSANSTANSAASTANAAKTSAASAVSTANSASSTASSAKSAADSLATMIREDSTGITVGKSADGETYSTGRTRMTAGAFEVLSNAGEVLSSFGASLVKVGTKAATVLLADILRIDALQTHPAVAGGSQLTVDVGRVSVPVHAESGTPWSAIELAGRNDTSGEVTTAFRVEFSVNNKDGSVIPRTYVEGGMNVSGTIELADKASTLATRKGLRITQGSKVCHGHGTPWVTLFESWSEFQSETGCYDSGLPTLVTMNGDWSAFDGSLSGCEIQGGKAVYVLAETETGIPNISSSQALRINWICIW